MEELDDLTCKDCFKQFKYRSLYQKHINKKKSCKTDINNIIADININDINDDNIDNTNNIEFYKQKYVNITHKINEKIKKSTADICYFYNKK